MSQIDSLEIEPLNLNEDALYAEFLKMYKEGFDIEPD